MKDFFTGVCTAMPTPFKKDLTIDYIAFKKMIEYQIKNGISALCILGTTGEAPTITFDEKIEIVKFAIDNVNGRVPIIFGIGGNNQENVIKLGTAIANLVADTGFKEVQWGARGETRNKIAILLSAPYYNKTTQDGAVEWFKTISNTVKLPMFVYNIPGRTGMNLTPETLEQISKFKYIKGIKQSTADMGQIIDTIRLCKCSVYAGDDGLALPCYAVGARGLISVASNVHPRETIKIYENFCNCGCELNAQFLNEIPLYNALFCEINPSPVKYALSLLGLCDEFVRPPLTVLSKKNIIAHGFHKFFGATNNKK